MTRALDIIDDTAPITLAEASELVLRGKVSVSTLRAEIRRGNLAVERIGKNLFTTPADIREMRNRCRVQQNRPASISGKTVDETSGLSATKTATDELGALKATVKALKNGSLNTLRKSTPRDRQEAASPIPFPSPKS